MAKSTFSSVPHTDGSVLEICQTIPGLLTETGGDEGAREVLLELVKLAGAGLLPERAVAVKGRKREAENERDCLGNLWFIQAGYAYYLHSQDAATWREALLPLAKRICQGIISGALTCVRMGDGGLLTRGDGEWDAEGLERNCLWYSAMLILSEELPKVGDRAGDHFERLSGRFRRSFLKGFWCEAHDCLCEQGDPEHPTKPFRVDPRQMLAVVLPFSAVPRTKQRLMVEVTAKLARTRLGMLMPPVEGEVRISPMCLAWLAEGRLITSETVAETAAEVIGWLRPLHEVLAGGGMVPKFYAAEALEKMPAKVVGHGPTMGELRRVWAHLQGVAAKAVPTVKRPRNTREAETE